MDNLVSFLAQQGSNPVLVQRVNQKMAELTQELSQLQKKRGQLLKNDNQFTDKEMQIDLLATALSGLKNHFNILSIHEKRTLIKLLVKKLFGMGKTCIFLSTTSKKLSATYSSFSSELPFGWWRISSINRNNYNVLCWCRHFAFTILFFGFDSIGRHIAWCVYDAAGIEIPL